MVVEMVQNPTFENFLHIRQLLIHIQHLYVFSINKLSTFDIYIYAKFNTYLYLQQLYLYTKWLSIQKFFIHSTIFYSFKIYCASFLLMEVTCFLQLINRGSKEAQAIIGTVENWDTDHVGSSSRTEKLLRSEHLRLCLTIFHWFFCKSFSLIFCWFPNSKSEKNVRKFCTQSDKLMVSLILVINGQGGFLFFPEWRKLLFQTNF